jgi:hypothetical protein
MGKCVGPPTLWGNVMKHVGVVGMTLLLAAGAAQAQPSPPPKPAPAPAPAAPAPAPAPAPCAAPPAAGAIETVTRAIADGVGRAPEGAGVFYAPIPADPAAPRAEALALEVARQVAGKLGPDVSLHETPVTLADARTAAKGLRTYLFLEVKIAGGRLLVTADAYRVPRTVWSRARAARAKGKRAARSGPVLHAMGQAPIDAEVRTYLTPLGFEAKPSVSKYQGADPEILALACGDLDGDGGTDLFTVTRARVLSVRLLSDGQVQREKEARWDDLAAVAPVPLREPIAFATVVEGSTAGGAGYLDASITDRATTARLDATLALTQQLEGLAVPHARATACTSLADMFLAPTAARCAAGDPPVAFEKLPYAFDAIASALLVSPSGHPKPALALRHDSTLIVHRAEGDEIIARVGAQLALGDVDQDGAPDVVSSLDTLSPKHDHIEVRTLLPDGTIKLRYRLPAPAGVRALAICPPDTTSRAPIIAATGTDLWVLR